MAVLGPHFCARAFSSCGKRGPLFIVVHWPLTIAASLVAEHRLRTRRLSNCGSRAQLLCGMWDPPRPGLEPVSPALAGRFSTTAPPGKPLIFLLKIILFIIFFFLFLGGVLCWVLVAACGVFVAAHRLLSSCGLKALSLRRVGSVVVVRRLSCPVAHGILVPQPGIEPTSPELEGGFFTTGPPGKSQYFFL